MSNATAEAATTTGHIKPKLGRDDWLMRGFMGLIAVYLVVTLALPLYTMMSKSFSTYSFDLGGYEFQVDKGEGWGETVSAAAIQAEKNLLGASDLAASNDSRLPASKLFPDFSFRAATKYRIRTTTPETSVLVS